MTQHKFESETPSWPWWIGQERDQDALAILKSFVINSLFYTLGFYSFYSFAILRVLKSKSVVCESLAKDHNWKCCSLKFQNLLVCLGFLLGFLVHSWPWTTRLPSMEIMMYLTLNTFLISIRFSMFFQSFDFLLCTLTLIWKWSF